MIADRYAFAATLAGRAARRALAPGAQGHVLAVFRRSLYFESRAGGLACFGPEAMGAGPLNVLCALPDGLDWEASNLRPGGAARVEGSRLVVDGRFTFELGPAAVWMPPTAQAGWTGNALAEGLAALAIAAASYDLAQGLAGLVVPGGAAPDSTMRAARVGIDALTAWLETATSGGERAEPPAAVSGLIGLGGGLTPSGDDFIGGALIALRMLGHGGAADRLAEWVAPRARSATGTISAAHLNCAADGEGAEALHRAIAALSAPGQPGLAGSLRDIDAIGHSSGWDALAGAVSVMRILSAAR